MSKVQSRFHPSLLTLLRQIKFSSLGFFFVSFIIPIIAYLNLEASGFQVGLLISIQVFGVMLCSPFAGHLANRRALRPQLAATGSFGRMLSYLIIYGAIILENYWLMLFGTFALGFSAGFFWAPLRAIVSDSTEYCFRSEAFGIFNQQIGLGTF
ncbi:MAG: MFS transporter, partial [Candidatus Hodarchaeota archaeon]